MVATYYVLLLVCDVSFTWDDKKYDDALYLENHRIHRQRSTLSKLDTPTLLASRLCSQYGQMSQPPGETLILRFAHSSK